MIYSKSMCGTSENAPSRPISHSLPWPCNLWSEKGRNCPPCSHYGDHCRGMAIPCLRVCVFVCISCVAWRLPCVAGWYSVNIHRHATARDSVLICTAQRIPFLQSQTDVDFQFPSIISANANAVFVVFSGGGDGIIAMGARARARAARGYTRGN